MRRILPYIFGLRALLVIIVMLAGFIGVNLDRAHAATVDPTPTPRVTTSEPTAQPVPDADADAEEPSGDGPSDADADAGTDDGSDGLPEGPSGDVDPVPGGAPSEGSSAVYVVATDAQLDGIQDAAYGIAFMLAAIACCVVAGLIIAAKGARNG